jgi:hypothetical protein
MKGEVHQQLPKTKEEISQLKMFFTEQFLPLLAAFFEGLFK